MNPWVHRVHYVLPVPCDLSVKENNVCHMCVTRKIMHEDRHKDGFPLLGKLSTVYLMLGIPVMQCKKRL